MDERQKHNSPATKITHVYTGIVVKMDGKMVKMKVGGGTFEVFF